MRNIIIALCLFLLMGVVGLVLFRHWWQMQTRQAAFPIERAAIPTSPAVVPAQQSFFVHRPLVQDEKVLSLHADGTQGSGIIRYTNSPEGVSLTVLVSSDVPKTATVWVIPPSGKPIRLGYLRVGKDGQFLDTTVQRDQLPVSIVVTKTAAANPMVAGERLFDTILSP